MRITTKLVELAEKIKIVIEPAEFRRILIRFTKSAEFRRILIRFADPADFVISAINARSVISNFAGTFQICRCIVVEGVIIVIEVIKKEYNM